MSAKIRVLFTKRRVIILLIAVLLLVWDIVIDPPAFWRSKRQNDKNAILYYAERTYPDDLKRKGGEFPLQKPAGPFEPSVMYFELDGVNFNIYAQDGKVTDDTYYEAKVEKYIRENFVDGFMNERGLSPEIEITFVHNSENYGKIRDDTLDDISSFKDSIWVTVTQDHIDGISSPRDVGWFYDFYQYWMENCDLTNCVVYIQYRPNKYHSTNEEVWFKRGKRVFSDENDFYKSFTT